MRTYGVTYFSGCSHYVIFKMLSDSKYYIDEQVRTDSQNSYPNNLMICLL